MDGAVDRSPRRPAGRWIILWVTCAGFACPCAAQGSATPPTEGSGRLQVGWGQERALAGGTNREAVGLSELVDPQRYRLAPGDELALAIGGPVDLTLTLQVTADGRLVIPSVGAVSVRELTLAAARETVAAAAAEAYPHSSMSLALLRPGLLRIPVTGQVAAPGSHTLLSTSRLGDWIARAEGFLPSADTRHVELHRAGMITQHDALAWLVDGRREEDPPLRIGDRIHVPAASAGIRVRGVIPLNERAGSSGRFLDRPFETESRWLPFRIGDRLDFALRASGWPRDHVSDLGVWLRRPGAGRWWVPREKLPATELAPGDVIEIPFQHEWVAVGGAVARPGLYPFLPGRLAADYIFLAGGPSSIGRSNGWKRLDPEGREISLAASDTLAAGERIWVPERRSHKLASLLTPLGTAVAVIVSVIALATNN